MIFFIIFFTEAPVYEALWFSRHANVYICALYNENIMLGCETESHYCNMFSFHLPHTVLFVSCDVFHIVVAVRIFSERKKKKNRQKRTFWPNMDKVYTKVHGKCGNMKSQWLFWNQDASETHWGGKGEQTRAEGWETADSDKETRRAYGGKRVGEKKVEMRINSIVFLTIS